MEPEEYHKMAAVEDAMWFYRALHAHVQRELSAALGDQAAQVLDAGCGTGGLIRRMLAAKPAWRWTGVDISPLACELARARTTAEIREASVTALPFPNASFDAVVSADVLYHVDDDAAALREFSRVLRPGGCVVINVPAHKWLWSYHDVATHSKRRYARSEVAAKLAAAGFAGVRVTHWNTALLPVVVMRRKFFPAPRSGSDVHLYSRPVEKTFAAVMALERAWLSTGCGLPLGSSILATATKR